MLGGMFVRDPKGSHHGLLVSRLCGARILDYDMNVEIRSEVLGAACKDGHYVEQVGVWATETVPPLMPSSVRLLLAGGAGYNEEKCIEWRGGEDLAQQLGIIVQ